MDLEYEERIREETQTVSMVMNKHSCRILVKAKMLKSKGDTSSSDN